MPRLRVFSGADLVALFEAQVFQLVRQRGSHVLMRRGSVSFPVLLYREVDRGTLAVIIIRQSGLPGSLFEM